MSMLEPFRHGFMVDAMVAGTAIGAVCAATSLRSTEGSSGRVKERRRPLSVGSVW